MNSAEWRVLVAPDSFKGTFAATEVADAIAGGLESDGRINADRCPLADGGEGTGLVLERGVGGTLIAAAAHDPLGRPITAHYSHLSGGTAVVEVAQASGLPLLDENERNPLLASSYGTGELIIAAVAAGARRVLVACGGSATVDGGEGILTALEESQLWVDVDFVCLSDVRTPWELAASTFGPQKGARPEDIPVLEERLSRIADYLPRDPRGVPMTGAAGGIAGALWAARGARLEPGGRFVIDALGVERRLASAHAVVVGEGRMDATTLEGKLVAELANMSAGHDVPAFAVVGQNALAESAVRRLGITAVYEAPTVEDLERAGAEIAKLLA